MSIFNVFRSVAQLSKGFWWGPHAGRAWMLTIGAFALALLDVVTQVALNHWTKDFFDAIERGIDIPGEPAKLGGRRPFQQARGVKAGGI